MNTNSDASSNFFALVWKDKWLVLLVTGLFAVGAIFLALSLPNKYRAEILLAPAESESSGGLGNLASQFGGIASIAGLSIPGGESNKSGQALALLQSRAFLQGFIGKRQLLPELLALESWDEDSGTLLYNDTVYDVADTKWVRTPPKNKAIIPTPWEGYPVLITMLDMSDIAPDGTLTIGLETVSPELSKQWLEWLVKDLNGAIAKNELDEARQSIIYLQKQIESTQLQELQSIFYRLIEEQTKKILLGEVREEYVFKVLAHPVLPEDRSYPSRGLIVIGLTFLGGMFSVLLVLIRFFLAR